MSSSKNSKLFWQYVKAKKQDSTGILTLNSLDGEAITKPTEKANVLNGNFRSIFTTEKLDNFPSKSNFPYPSMPDFDITTQGVYNILITWTKPKQIFRSRQVASFCSKSHSSWNFTYVHSHLPTIPELWSTTSSMEACLCYTSLQERQ